MRVQRSDFVFSLQNQLVKNVLIFTSFDCYIFCFPRRILERECKHSVVRRITQELQQQKLYSQAIPNLRQYKSGLCFFKQGNRTAGLPKHQALGFLLQQRNQPPVSKQRNGEFATSFDHHWLVLKLS